MRILLAGCGYVGRRLAQCLADGGHEVFCIRLGEGRREDGWFTLRMDLCDPVDTELLPCDLDAVVYLPAARSRDGVVLEQLYTRGPVALHQAVSFNSVGFRFVMVSSTGVYGQVDGEVVDEGSVAVGSTASSRALLAGEEMVLGLPDSVVLRFSGIYGPGRDRLVRVVREGAAVPGVLQGRFLNQIHVDDCVGLLAFVLGVSGVSGVLIGSDELPALRGDVLAWLAGRMGCDVPVCCDEDVVGGGRGRTSKRCNSEKVRDLGYSFVYPTYREGYGGLLGGG